MKRSLILIKKLIPNAVFVLMVIYVILNPDRLGTWFGVFMRNVGIVVNGN